MIFLIISQGVVAVVILRLFFKTSLWGRLILLFILILLMDKLIQDQRVSYCWAEIRNQVIDSILLVEVSLMVTAAFFGCQNLKLTLEKCGTFFPLFCINSTAPTHILGFHFTLKMNFSNLDFFFLFCQLFFLVLKSLGLILDVIACPWRITTKNKTDKWLWTSLPSLLGKPGTVSGKSTGFE